MLDIAGQPMLGRMLERVRRANTIDELLVATTSDPSDDILEQFCWKQDLPCYRGSLLDVLDRCYQAASNCRADVVIRLTADCPLIDPDVIDRTVHAYFGLDISQASTPILGLPDPDLPGPFDFAADRLPPPWDRTLPIGLDVEVCSFAALQRAWEHADQPFQREHVLPYLYEGVTFSSSSPPASSTWYLQTGITPRGFRVALLNHRPDMGFQRWTVDTPADLEFVRQVYAHFVGQPDFSWMDVVRLLEHEPGLASINAGVTHKSAFDVDHRSGSG
jgi:spore coat polysaccharide biosynthesis protein SpsF